MKGIKRLFEAITSRIGWQSGHPGYNMSFREQVLCTLGFHRDTVTDNVGAHYCGRCGRPNPVDLKKARLARAYGSERH